MVCPWSIDCVVGVRRSATDIICRGGVLLTTGLHYPLALNTNYMQGLTVECSYICRQMLVVHCCAQGLIVEGQIVTWPKKGDSPDIATVLPTVLIFVIMPVAYFAATIRVADLRIPHWMTSAQHHCMLSAQRAGGSN